MLHDVQAFRFAHLLAYIDSSLALFIIMVA